MKKTLLALACAMGSFTMYAQVESSDEVSTDTASSTQATTMNSATGNAGDTTGVSEEDLRKYAVLMDSVESMKKTLIGEISDMVKENEAMTNARYNDLSKANGDEAKLKEMGATADEIAFVQQVIDKKKEGATAISETFQNMAKDYIGVETYNEVKNALATDSELKARYETILEEVQNEDTASTK